MRGVDLRVFEFDFDLTWAAVFLGPEGTVYGRYGGRTAQSPDDHLSLPGLRYAMKAALAAHQRHSPARTPDRELSPQTVEHYPAARQLSSRACIHCHQVYDFRRQDRQKAGTWRLEEVWVYPLPENIGLTMAVDRGDRVRRVSAGSAADRAGLKAGDVLRRLNNQPIASIADVQYALHRAPARGKVPVQWDRAGNNRTGWLSLAGGWRKTDLSWRWSLRGVDPAPGVDGEDLEPAEKKALGLAADRLAFRQHQFLTPAVRQAGVRPGDVIIGIDGRLMKLTARQFGAYVRLNCQVGQRVTLNLLRQGKRLNLLLELAGR
jgi:hypothetical protein